ncbi:MAG: hypothetical protein OXS29_09365 [bacterium]|nr:hypothetical protein [bacterium]MDE0288636.1 hypothetical protein [bacterium]MDE0439854.1 hypothetical protein [bacterium]
MQAGTTGVQSRTAEVLAFFEERKEEVKPPFGDVLELFDCIKDQGSDLEDIDVGVAVGRLVCEGKLRYALDGIRLTGR